MKFYCNAQDLSDNLSIVSKAVSQKSGIQLLEGIKIEAKGNVVTLTATDTDLYIQKTMFADIKLEGEALVTGRFFSEFIKKLNAEDTIEIEKFREKLVVRYGQNESEFLCFNEQMFPMAHEPGDNYTCRIKESDLKALIEGTLFCVAQDDTHPILRGVLFHFFDGKVEAVGLDGYRLALVKAPVEGLNEPKKIVVSGRILAEIARILKDSDDLLEIYVCSNLVQIKHAGLFLTGRLIEGEYMKYQDIINRKCYTTVEIARKVLEDSIQRAFLLCRNANSNQIKLIIKENSICVRTNSEIGSIHEEHTCTVVGNDLSIGFNGRYFLDALSRIKEDFIKIEFSSVNAPAVVKPLEGDRFNYVLIPVKLV